VAGSVAASPSPAHPPPAGSARPIGSIPAGSRIGFGEASAAVPRFPFGEGVADAADRHDERRNGRVVLDLVAEMADVDVDRLLVLVEGLVVAQELEELAPGVDPTGARGEVAQDLELGRGQADPPIATLDAAPLEVDDEVAVADDPPARGVTEVAVRPPEQGLDPTHQLAQPERLRQVVVRAELEPDHLVDLVVARRQHQHRCLRAGCPEPAQDLEPVHARQPDVEHDEVRRLVGREVEPFLAALRDRHLVALLLQGVLDPAGDRELVLDDQDRGTHGGPTVHRAASDRAGRLHGAASLVCRDKVCARSGRPDRTVGEPRPGTT
jgi:hypothetical protein